MPRAAPAAPRNPNSRSRFRFGGGAGTSDEESFRGALGSAETARSRFVPYFLGGPWGAHQVGGPCNCRTRIRTRIRTRNEPKPSQGEVPGGLKTTPGAQVGPLLATPIAMPLHCGLPERPGLLFSFLNYTPDHPLRAVLVDGQKWQRLCSQF